MFTGYISGLEDSQPLTQQFPSPVKGVLFVEDGSQPMEPELIELTSSQSQSDAGKVALKYTPDSPQSSPWLNAKREMLNSTNVSMEEEGEEEQDKLQEKKDVDVSSLLNKTIRDGESTSSTLLQDAETIRYYAEYNEDSDVSDEALLFSPTQCKKKKKNSNNKTSSTPQDVPLDLTVPKAPQKPNFGKRSVTIRIDEENTASDAKRRNVDLFGMTVYNFFKPDTSEFIVLQEPDLFTRVKPYLGTVYVCIRKFKFSQVKLEWQTTRIGLNLSAEEWSYLCQPRLLGLILDAVDQELHGRPPKPKTSVELEKIHPTSFPEYLGNGLFEHRHGISANKLVAIGKNHSPTGQVTVSLLQFDVKNEFCNQEPRGVHLTLDAWNELLRSKEEIDRRVAIEMKKINVDYRSDIDMATTSSAGTGRNVKNYKRKNW